MNFIKRWFRVDRSNSIEVVKHPVAKHSCFPYVTKVDEVVWRSLGKYTLELSENFILTSKKYTLVAGDLELIQTLGSCKFMVRWKKQTIGWTDDPRLNKIVADRGNVLAKEWIENNYSEEKRITAEDVLKELESE